MEQGRAEAIIEKLFSVPKIKCEHGVHLSPGETLSWGCQQCYPNGHPEVTENPVLPRSSGDTMGRKESERELCGSCGNMRTYSGPACLRCLTPFPDDGHRGRGQVTANSRQVGACPECGSCVHYDTEKKSVWECSDCGEKFRAPKVTEASDGLE